MSGYEWIWAIKAFDELADFTYKRLVLGNIVFVYGKLKQDCVKAWKLIIMKWNLYV